MRPLFFLLAVSVMNMSFATAQETKTIQLKQEPAPYAPKTYYIANVTDSIPDSTGIGTLNEGGVAYPLALNGGMAAAVKSYIDESITEDKTQPPLILNIKNLHVEIKKKGIKWIVSIASTFAFYSGNQKLSQFSSSGQSETTGDPGEYLEKELRRAVQRNMEDFEKWWVQQKDKFAISDEVKINATIAKTTDMKSYIVYDIRRPLQQADFKGEVRDDLPEKATTFSGNLLATSSLVQKGQLVFSIAVTPYFDKTQSWFNPVNTNPMLLSHEQAHFDITAIKTCELVTALRKAVLTKENYQEGFKLLTQQYETQTAEEQNAYDTETAHGTIQAAQQAWQEKISQQVKASGCY